MHSLAIFALAVLSVGQVRPQQTCSVENANVFFVLDLSETARREATTNGAFTRTTADYDLLRDSLRTFAVAPELASYRASTTNLRVGFVSYTGFENSGRTQATLTRALGSLNDMINNVVHPTNGNIPDRTLTNNGVETGGSWTYNGCEELERQIASGALSGFPSGADNWVFLISAQGTFNRARQQRAIQCANRLKGTGFRIFITGLVIQNDEFNLDIEELGGMATSADTFIKISTYGNTNPADDLVRPTLPEALGTFIRNYLLTCTAPSNPCSGCDFSTGKYVVPDPDTCAGFLLCHPDLTWTKMDCGSGTLYNADLLTCGRLNQYNCPAWGMCTDTTQQNFPGKCCHEYYECDRGTVTFRTCPGDQIFDVASRRCVGNTASSFSSNCGVQDAYQVACRLNTNTGRILTCDRNGVLYRAIPDRPCFFEQGDLAGNYFVQRCAEGTGWDTTICNCNVGVASCAVVPPVRPVSPTCESRFHLDFNGNPNLPPRALDDADGGRELTWWVNRHTATLTGQTARFLGNSGREADVVSVPYFNNRAWPTGFSVSVRFQLGANAVRGQEYDIMANDNCGQCSSRSLYLRASVTSADRRQIRLRFDVQDQSGRTLTLQADVTLSTANDWVEVVLAVRGTRAAAVAVVTRADGTTVNTIRLRESVTNAEEVTIAGGISRVHCALGLGQGPTNAMIGEIDDFKYRECDDPFTVLQ